MNDELRGYLLILAAGLFWGISATVAKLLLAGRVDTILLVQTRVTFSAVLMGAWYALFVPRHLRVEPRDLWRFLLLGVLGIAGANVTYYHVIKESSVATAILLQYTAPFLVLGWAAVSGEERVTGPKVAAASLALAGCFLAVGGLSGEAAAIPAAALLVGLLSAVCFAFLNVFPRHLAARASVWSMTFYALVFASLFWLAVNPPWSPAVRAVDTGTWAVLLGFALISVLIPHTLYFTGLRFVPPSRAIVTSTFEPVVAIVSAALLAGELLAPVQVVGAVCVLSAIVLLQRSREAPRA